MEVEVRVFATLRRYLPELGIGEPKHLQVPAGTSLDQIREMLGLPAEEVKVIMVNHLQAQPQDEAKNGDRITFIPAVAGG
jgi:molybdopterin synthase sulfur carrier subunit